MADAAPKPQRTPRRRRTRNTSETKVDVTVTETDKTTATPRRRRNPRRRRRIRRPVFGPWLPGQGPRRSGLRRAIKKEIKREGLDGPRVSVQQKVSSTFGLVGPNKSGNVELELNFFLHPSLAKEANDGTSFGPVQALAAQYALWKLKYLRLIFTPMVGASAVSGTVIRASLNLSQSPGGTNWSGLGTRIHLDIHPGQTAIFTLRGDQIGGPRDGGWWMTDTNEEGSQSAGPIIEVHTLGKTESTFQAKDWESPLFIVEGIGLWQFANYQVKPALGMLERRQAEVEVGMTAVPGNPITIELPTSASIATFMLNAEPETKAVPSTNSVGETIFQIVDVGADLAKTFTPPPFSWLISGGWWFLKRVFGKDRDGKASFNVYPSLADAQNDRPAIAGPTANVSGSTVNADLVVTQINAPNVGPQPSASAMIRAAVPVPLQFGTFRLHTEMYPMELISWDGPTGPWFPTSYIIGAPHVKSSTTPATYYFKTAWYVAKDLGEPGTGTQIAANPPTANGAYIHTMYRLENPRFASLDGNVEYIPPQPKSGAALYFGDPSKSTSNSYWKVGDVVATAHVMSDANHLSMVLTLIKLAVNFPSTAEQRDLSLLRSSQGGNTSADRKTVKFQTLNISSGSTTNVRTMDMANGQYMLGVSYAGDIASTATQVVSNLVGTNVDLAISLPLKQASSGQYASDALFRLDPLNTVPTELPKYIPYGLGGNMFATFSADINLNYVGPVTIESDLLQKLIALGVNFTPEKPELLISDSESSSDDEIDDADLELLIDLLAEAGRLPTRAEIAARDGNYREAYRIYKAE
nr:MAG: ORF2 [Bat astrovirus]